MADMIQIDPLLRTPDLLLVNRGEIAMLTWCGEIGRTP